MFYVGYFFGVLSCGLYLFLGYFAYRFTKKVEAEGSVTGPISQIFSSRRGKLRPKFVSDEMQWKKEQAQAPLDPGI